MADPPSLNGQVALVTGGAGGIGRAIARALARAGASAVVVDLDQSKAVAVAAEIGADGGRALGLAGDVTSEASVADVFAAVRAHVGRLDVLVNNAGIYYVSKFPDVPLDAWRRVFAVNVEGALLMTQGAAAIMSAQEPHPASGRRGTIVNVSSGAADVGRPFMAPYGASKAALNHLSKTSALVLGERGICTTVLYPTNVMEGMWKGLAQELGAAEGIPPETAAAERAATSPTGRFQTPDEVAATALYLVATPGMRLNGQLLHSEAHMSRL